MTIYDQATPTGVGLAPFSNINGDRTQPRKTTFRQITDGTFAATTNRFAYDTSTGKLYYDAQGSASGSTSSLIAELTNKPHLTAANLFFTS